MKKWETSVKILCVFHRLQCKPSIFVALSRTMLWVHLGGWDSTERSVCVVRDLVDLREMQEVRDLASVDQEHPKHVRWEKGRIIAMATGELESDSHWGIQWQLLPDAEERCRVGTRSYGLVQLTHDPKFQTTVSFGTLSNRFLLQAMISFLSVTGVVFHGRPDPGQRWQPSPSLHLVHHRWMALWWILSSRPTHLAYFHTRIKSTVVPLTKSVYTILQ